MLWNVPVCCARVKRVKIWLNIKQSLKWEIILTSNSMSQKNQHLQIPRGHVQQTGIQNEKQCYTMKQFNENLTLSSFLLLPHRLRWHKEDALMCTQICTGPTEPVFANVCGVQKSIPRNLFRQAWEPIPGLLQRFTNTGTGYTD